jgi:autotransporter-associated beta strand protein
VPGGYAAQSAGLLNPSGNNQLRQAYLLAATVFTKITGLDAASGTSYSPSISNFASLAGTAVTTTNTHKSTIHYSTSRENSGLIRYRAQTPANNSVRYAWTGTSTETGISNTLNPIIAASGYTAAAYQASSTLGWSQTSLDGATATFNAAPDQFQFAYGRTGFISLQGQAFINTNQANLLPFSFDRHYDNIGSGTASINNVLDDIYSRTEEQRSECNAYGWLAIPFHLGAARLNDINPAVIFSSDGTHVTAPLYTMMASMMVTSALGREPTPPAAVLADPQQLAGFNIGKQTIRQLAFLSETEAPVPDTSISIAPPPPLQAIRNQAFSFVFAATGGTEPYTWSVESAAGLPAGLTLSSGGNLSGIATADPGQFQLVLKVTDGTGGMRKAPVLLTIALTGPGTLAISPADGLSFSRFFGSTLPSTSQQFTISNVGTTSINWTASNAASWLTLSPSSGTLAAGVNATVIASINSNANPLAIGSYGDTVIFTNTTNNNGNATRSVSLKVNEPGTGYIWAPNGNNGGTGTWDTSTANWNTGPQVTWPSSGINNDATFGGAAGTVTISGGVTANDVTFGVTGYTISGTPLTLNGGTVPVITTAASTTTTIQSGIAGTSGFVKSGAGTLVIDSKTWAANPISGALTVNGGTLVVKDTSGGNVNISSALYAINSLTVDAATVSLASPTQNGLGVWGMSVTIQNGGILSEDNTFGGGSNLWALTLNGGTLASTPGRSFTPNSPVSVGGSAQSSISAGIFLGSTGTFNVADAVAGTDLLVSGVISGNSVGFTKTGNGTMELRANNTFNGPVVVNEGTLVLNDSSGTNVNIGYTVANVSSVLIDSGTMSLQGTQNALGVTGRALTIQNGGAVSADRTDGGAHNLAAVTMNGGNLVAGVSGGSYQLNGNVTVGGSAVSTISAPISLNGGVRTFDVANAVTGSATDLLVSGAVSNGSVTKTGPGTMTLTRTNTYSGNTIVNAGTLLVNGGLANSSVTVNGGVLGGTGWVGGSSTVSAAASVAPGSTGIGTFTLASASIAGTYSCEISGASADLLQITGTLTVSPGATVAISILGEPTQAEYLIAAFGSLSGSLPEITGVPPGYQVDTTQPGTIRLVRTDGYASWADSWDNPPLSNKTTGGDPDHDGVSNLLEFVLGGDPRVSDPSVLPQSAISGDFLILSFKRSHASVLHTQLVGQWSTDLVEWNDIETILVSENPDGTDNMEIRIPLSHADDGRLFGRLKAVTNGQELLTEEDVLTVMNGEFYLDGNRFAEISFNKFDLAWSLYGELQQGRELNDENPIVMAQEQALINLKALGFEAFASLPKPGESIWRKSSGSQRASDDFPSSG